MNREILFRAWHKQKKIMCDVLLICFVNRYVNVLPEYQLEGGNQEEWRFDEIELMQFTGLTDMMGQKIFEGDVVRPSASHISANCIVVWGHSGFALSYADWVNQFAEHVWKEVEVIGNIHQTPELLNQQQ